ncbi:class I SAM-dependent methyltransferase [Fictibacillus enclensis]|uniref:class I SAM-dependent methyltransferase n=1 Tax=Fictibacillus enclensis TaxID=1017270 RepID=UPI0025A1250D|nr:class I SAM-dependent methyltransferase [Fictibacillus enclensis]MDM5337771.1 class I SAM-dependent methyltransferase [Fictibacillus enclensis]
MIHDWIKLWRARSWMKRNQSFLYTWHAYVGYTLDLFNAFQQAEDIARVAARMQLNKLLLERWIEVGLAIGHLKRKRNGKIIASRMLKQYVSKESPYSVGILLKEMLELHIPVLLSYPELMRGEKSKLFAEEEFAYTVAETSTLIEKLAFPKIHQVLKRKGVRSVLDLGCGHAGYLQKIASKNPEMRLTGVEKNKEVYEEALKRCHEYNQCIELFQVDLKQFTISEKVELIMMNNLLYYFPPKERIDIMCKANSLLTNGGTLVIITPLSDYKNGNAFASAFNSFMSAHENLYPLPSYKEIQNAAVQSGFKIEETRPIIKEGAWCMICLEKKAVSAAEQQQMTC